MRILCGLFALFVLAGVLQSSSARDYTKDAEAVHFVSLGQEQFEKKNYQVAISFYSKALQLNPENAEAMMGRGVASMRLGETEKALPDLLQETKLRPNYMGAWFELGDAYLSLHKFQEALDALTHAIALQNVQNRVGMRSLYHARAEVYHALKQYDKAIADLTTAIECGKNPAGDIAQRAKFQAERGQFEKAVADYTKAISLKPKDPKILAERARLFFGAKKYDLAAKDWGEVIRLNPTRIEAFLERAKAYDKLGKHDLADRDRAGAKKIESEM
jgi:tetratricopeptide (TPR) repeat protein